VKIQSGRALAGAAIALAAIVGAACQSANEESQSAAVSAPAASASSVPSTSASEAASASAPASGAPSAGSSAPAGEETSVFDIEAGDCFSVDESAEIETVFVVDCESPHIYEAYEVFDHEAGADAEYPGDDEILEYADTECQVPFEEFVGIAYEDSIWFITSVTPSAETWAEGDREIICTVALEDYSEVTGSAGDSAE
jgi:hypothetical protein